MGREGGGAETQLHLLPHFLQPFCLLQPSVHASSTEGVSAQKGTQSWHLEASLGGEVSGGGSEVLTTEDHPLSPSSLWRLFGAPFARHICRLTRSLLSPENAASVL